MHSSPSLFQQQAPADSMHERSEERQKASGGQSSNRPSTFQQQQDQIHRYGTAPQQIKAPMSRLPEELHGNPLTYAAPTSILREYAHPDGPSSTRHHFMYPTLSPAVPLQWNSGVGTQTQDQYCVAEPATFSQPMQAGRPLACTSPMCMTTGTHPTHAPTGSHNSGFEWITQSASPLTFGGRPPSVNAPLMTGSDSLSAGYRSASGGHLPVFAAALPDSIQEPTRLFPDEASRARTLSGLSARDIATHSPHLMWPISPDEFVYPKLSQPERSWRGREGMPIHPYQPGEPSKELILDPAGHPSLSTFSSPTPAAVVRHGGPSFQATPQANPATSRQSPGLEARGSGTGSNLGTTNGGPTPSNHPTGPNRSAKTTPKRSVKPYERTKTRPIPHEGNLALLRQRCLRQGADEIAVGFLPKIFANNQVNLEALTRPLTDVEVGSGEFGGRTGKVYTAFLNYTQEDHAGAPRHICRLCRSAQTWKHAKDVLRHLRRDHFGLSTICEQWYALTRSLKRIVHILTRKCSDRKFYTPGEMTRHRCK